MGEAAPDMSPKSSRAGPFVAQEICQGWQRSSLSMLHAHESTLALIYY
jgi:hypothetical protein